LSFANEDQFSIGVVHKPISPQRCAKVDNTFKGLLFSQFLIGQVSVTSDDSLDHLIMPFFVYSETSSDLAIKLLPEKLHLRVMYLVVQDVLTKLCLQIRTVKFPVNLRPEEKDAKLS
jgi:hypothetical protein